MSLTIAMHKYKQERAALTVFYLGILFLLAMYLLGNAMDLLGRSFCSCLCWRVSSPFLRQEYAKRKNIYEIRTTLDENEPTVRGYTVATITS
jgi:hypothetical protein